MNFDHFTRDYYIILELFVQYLRVETYLYGMIDIIVVISRIYANKITYNFLNMLIQL
jgi:hypothetical protein